MPLRLSPSHGRPVPLIKFHMTPGFGLLRSSGFQIGMSEFRQSFTLTQNVGWGLLLCTTSPTQGTVNQSHYVEMSSQGVMSIKKANNYPGFTKCFLNINWKANMLTCTYSTIFAHRRIISHNQSVPCTFLFTVCST